MNEQRRRFEISTLGLMKSPAVTGSKLSELIYLLQLSPTGATLTTRFCGDKAIITFREFVEDKYIDYKG